VPLPHQGAELAANGKAGRKLLLDSSSSANTVSSSHVVAVSKSGNPMEGFYSGAQPCSQQPHCLPFSLSLSLSLSLSHLADQAKDVLHGFVLELYRGGKTRRGRRMTPRQSFECLPHVCHMNQAAHGFIVCLLSAYVVVCHMSATCLPHGKDSDQDAHALILYLLSAYVVVCTSVQVGACMQDHSLKGPDPCKGKSPHQIH
jgi:hypothetical protein